MPNYVALATVTARLPSGHGLSNETVEGFITDASGEIEEMAGTRYSLQFNSSTQKFPEIDDGTYTTPKTIEKCAMWLTLSYCYEEMEKANRYKDANSPPNKTYYRNLCTEKMQEVAAGTVDLGITITSKFYAVDKYPDDEDGMDREFTNENLDSYQYG